MWYALTEVSTAARAVLLVAANPTNIKNDAAAFMVIFSFNALLPLFRGKE